MLQFLRTAMVPFLLLGKELSCSQRNYRASIRALLPRDRPRSLLRTGLLLPGVLVGPHRQDARGAHMCHSGRVDGWRNQLVPGRSSVCAGTGWAAVRGRTNTRSAPALWGRRIPRLSARLYRPRRGGLRDRVPGTGLCCRAARPERTVDRPHLRLAALSTAFPETDQVFPSAGRRPALAVRSLPERSGARRRPIHARFTPPCEASAHGRPVSTSAVRRIDR